MNNLTTQKLILVSLIASILGGSAYATTYKTISHGKFSDENIWQPTYPGNILKAGDSVVINSQVVLNIPIAVEGTLFIEKGAALQGNKEIRVAKSGLLENKGNTVVKRLSNEGKINNELILEAMMEVDNSGVINNTATTFAGSTLLNKGGVLDGNKGSYFSNNTVIASPNSVYGKDINVFQASFTNPAAQIDESIYCNASLNVVAGGSDKVLVEITSASLKNMETVILEKSIDGKIFYKVAEAKAENSTLLLEDRIAMENTLWYRISAYDLSGKQYQFPEALVKISDKSETLSMLNRISY